ncbi:MAG TPA: nucleoside-diphosphate kinase [Chthoniobacterales bacterium]|jgi:nucleoside diphosphate kinase
MPEELSYILITPHSIRKSRTGGIISRVMSRTGLELVAGRMFAPSPKLVEAYAETIITDPDPRHAETQGLIRAYVQKNFAPDSNGIPARVLMLIFRGPNAVSKVRNVVGHIANERTRGETIRDTYGDYVLDETGKVVYFEPAALAPPDTRSAESNLKLWASFSDADGGILDKAITYPAGSNIQKTLVLIKPDNFRFPNGRPGAVIDLFSRSGLSIIAFKVHRMSVDQAERFYEPVLDILQEINRVPVANRSALALEQELGFPVPTSVKNTIGNLLGPIAGRIHWESLVKFMAGRRPSECSEVEKIQPGSEKCVALVYQGVDAVRKIRDILGPTDPSKAPTGSIRREFGESIMINAAHASDSPDNAKREMAIVRVTENNLKPLVENHYGSL